MEDPGLHNASDGDRIVQLLPKASAWTQIALPWLASLSGTSQKLDRLKAFCLVGMGQEIKVAHPSVSIYWGAQSPQNISLISFWGLLYHKGENLCGAFVLMNAEIINDVGKEARSMWFRVKQASPDHLHGFTLYNRKPVGKYWHGPI